MTHKISVRFPPITLVKYWELVVLKTNNYPLYQFFIKFVSKRTEMNKVLYLTAIYCLCMFYACGSSKQATKSKNLKKYNQASIYSQSSALPNIHIKVHHTSNDSTDIYLGFPTNRLKVDSLQKARFQITYELYKDLNAKKIDYSLVANFEVDQAQQLSDYTSLKNSLKIPQGRNYVLKLIVQDQVSFKNYYLEKLITKSDTFNPQNFLATNAYNQKVLFNHFNSKNSRIRVRYRNTSNKPLTIKHYRSFRELALPTFKLKRKHPYIYQLDSTFTTKDGIFTLSRLGTYSIQVEEAPENGLILVSVDKRFPNLANAKDLVEALRYITKSEEFESMIRADNSKAAVDSFWMKRAGSFDRGKVLVKEFYGRVQRANQFFTTYKEGWKTDRGVVLVIYGEPDIVYKSVQSEQWIYESTASQNRISFTFELNPNSFTQSELRLIRSTYYEDSWHRSVYEWRKGLVGKKSRAVRGR